MMWSYLSLVAVKGQKRIRVLMKRGGAALMDHLKKLLESSQLVDEISQHPDERGKGMVVIIILTKTVRSRYHMVRYITVVCVTRHG